MNENKNRTWWCIIVVKISKKQIRNMQNITKNTQNAIPWQEKIKTNETIKTPEYNTQKFDTNINQKMYNYFSFEIPILLSTDAVLTLAPEVVVRRWFQNMCS